MIFKNQGPIQCRTNSMRRCSGENGFKLQTRHRVDLTRLGSRLARLPFLLKLELFAVIVSLGFATWATQIPQQIPVPVQAAAHSQGYSHLHLDAGDQVVFPDTVNLDAGVMPRDSWDTFLILQNLLQKNPGLGLIFAISNFSIFQTTVYQGTTFTADSTGKYVVWAQNTGNTSQTLTVTKVFKPYFSYGIDAFWFGVGGMVFSVLTSISYTSEGQAGRRTEKRSQSAPQKN